MPVRPIFPALPTLLLLLLLLVLLLLLLQPLEVHVALRQLISINAIDINNTIRRRWFWRVQIKRAVACAAPGTLHALLLAVVCGGLAASSAHRTAVGHLGAGHQHAGQATSAAPCRGGNHQRRQRAQCQEEERAHSEFASAALRFPGSE